MGGGSRVDSLHSWLVIRHLSLRCVRSFDSDHTYTHTQCASFYHICLSVERWGVQIFGGFTSADWKVCPRYYGSGECFVYQVRTAEGQQSGARTQVKTTEWATGSDESNRVWYRLR